LPLRRAELSLIGQLNNYCLLAVVLAIIGPANLVQRAIACERCRSLGSPLFHDFALATPQSRAKLLATGDGSVDQTDSQGNPQFVAYSGWPQPGGKGTPVTLTYSFQNMFDGALKMPDGQALPASLIRGSIEEALRLWSSVAPLNFVEVPDDGLAYGQGSTKYGQLRFRHIYINGADPAVGMPVAKAQAYYPTSGDPNAGDVEFDEGDRWQESGTLSIPDVLGAAIHEIGHTLGLGHSLGTLPSQFWYYNRYNSTTGQIEQVAEPKGDANMFWIFTRGTGLGSGRLFDDDIKGIQFLYGAGTGSVTSLVVPELATVTLAILSAIALLPRRLRI
jgi:hypothetical protein